MGALFTQQIATARWAEFLAWLRAGPGQLIGTSLNARPDYQEPRYAGADLPPRRQRIAGPAAGL